MNIFRFLALRIEYKSYENRYRNWIRETNLFMDKTCEFRFVSLQGFGIHTFFSSYSTKDSWRFVRIRWIHENRLNLWKLDGFVMYDTKQIFPICICEPQYDANLGFVLLGTNHSFLESGFVVTIQYKSMDSRNKSTGARYPDTLPSTLVFCLSRHSFFQSFISRITESIQIYLIFLFQI